MLPLIVAAVLSFARVPVPENVPAEMCTALAQDARGFIWIGTQAGVVRFDGQHYKVYPPPPGGSYVRSLLATRDGRVWAGTFSGGISVLDAGSEQQVHYLTQLSHPRVEGLEEDSGGAVWAATQEGLDRIDPRSGRVEHFHHDATHPRSLADDRVRVVMRDRGGQLWVGTYDGLQVRRGDGFDRVAPELRGQLVTKLLEDPRGRIWIGTAEKGAFLLDPHTGAFRRLEGLSHFWIYGFAQAGPNEMWIATFGGGVDVLDMSTLAVVNRIRTDPTLPDTIGGDRIGALLRDRSGVLWVGTWGQGLARHDPATRAFQALRFSPTHREGVSHPAAVRAMQMQDGTIWVGTNGNGIDILDTAFHRIGGDSLGGAAVTCLAQADDGTIWVATLDGNLRRRRPGAHSFDLLAVADGLPGGPIRAMTFGPGGALWVGAAKGMSRIDASGIRTYRHDRDDARTLSGSAVEAIAFTPDGTMWVGTDTGLNAFDPERGVAARIAEGLPAKWVPDLMVDRGGRLWIATPAGACILTSWDGRHATFARVADKLRQPATPVEALIQDDEGQVWLGPRLRVDPVHWTARELGPSDGCAFRSFFIASRARMTGGALLFGSPDGLLVVQPRALRPWTFAPPVVATSLRVGDAEVPLPSVLTLRPGARAFRLDVAALDFTAPERNLYRYRLDPFDPRWITTDATRRSMTYTNLPPGEYVLHVQATNRAGVWSPHELRLPVHALPAFYETAWFRGALLLLLAAAMYGLYRLRIHQLGRKAEQLERLVRERTVELEAAYARIEEASLTDPLTRLRNRRYLEQAITADTDLALRRNEDLVFLLVDLDHFKSVNDTWGHAAGDAVLVQTADVLRATFRASDHLVRWGGEEFLVVARFIDRRNAGELAEKLRAAIDSHAFTLEDGQVLNRTCSVGVAAYPLSDLTWEQVVQLADEALYEAKRNGRNQWRSGIGFIASHSTAQHERRKDTRS